MGRASFDFCGIAYVKVWLMILQKIFIFFLKFTLFWYIYVLLNILVQLCISYTVRLYFGHAE